MFHRVVCFLVGAGRAVDLSVSRSVSFSFDLCVSSFSRILHTLRYVSVRFMTATTILPSLFISHRSFALQERKRRRVRFRSSLEHGVYLFHWSCTDSFVLRLGSSSLSNIQGAPKIGKKRRERAFFPSPRLARRQRPHSSCLSLPPLPREHHAAPSCTSPPLPLSSPRLSRPRPAALRRPILHPRKVGSNPLERRRRPPSREDERSRSTWQQANERPRCISTLQPQLSEHPWA